jgi:hypothetical protein
VLLGAGGAGATVSGGVDAEPGARGTGEDLALGAAGSAGGGGVGATGAGSDAASMADFSGGAEVGLSIDAVSGRLGSATGSGLDADSALSSGVPEGREATDMGVG